MTPRPTAVALVATLVLTATALASFLLGPWTSPRPFLAFFTALFAVRVAGQLVVLARSPGWLPPTAEWNLVPYRFLLPLQLVLLALMLALALEPGACVPVTQASPGLARSLVVFAFAYSAATAGRYAFRMARRPEQRWLGGTIPIVFHCVLAAALFVLGWANA